MTDYDNKFSLKLPKTTRERLEKLSKATGETKAFLAMRAIEKYLSTKDGNKKADKKTFQ